MFARQSMTMLAVAAASLVGCGGSDGPETAAVTGTVTSDGAPVAGASVTFEPVGNGRGSVGQTDGDGEYYLLFTADREGALIGTHRVSIRVPPPVPPGTSAEEAERGLLGMPQTVLSGETVEVVAGDNVHDFDVPAFDPAKAADPNASYK